ncbi:UNVERIFIED_CONTAM: hypothetical protein FKN15_002546 [Acipenser sinensis]
MPCVRNAFSIVADSDLGMLLRGAAMFHRVELLVEHTGLFRRTSRTRPTTGRQNGFARSDCPVVFGLTKLRL